MAQKTIWIVAAFLLLLCCSASAQTIIADNAIFTGMQFSQPVLVTASVNVSFFEVNFTSTLYINDSVNVVLNRSRMFGTLTIVGSGTVDARRSYWATAYSPINGTGACEDGAGTQIVGSANIINWYVDSALTTLNGSCNRLAPNITLVYPGNNTDISYIDNSAIVTQVDINITTQWNAVCAYNDTADAMTALADGNLFNTTGGHSHSAQFNLVNNRGDHEIQIFCQNLGIANATSMLAFYAYPPPAPSGGSGGGATTIYGQANLTQPLVAAPPAVEQPPAQPSGLLSVTGAAVGDIIGNKAVMASLMLVGILTIIIIGNVIILKHEKSRRSR